MIHTLDRAQQAAQQRNWATLTHCLRQLVPTEIDPQDMSHPDSPALPGVEARPAGTVPRSPEPSSPSRSPRSAGEVTEMALDLAMAGLIEGDFQSRWDLAKIVPKFGIAAIEPLVELLDDEDLEWDTRWFAARILGEIRHPTVLTHLINLLQTHRDPELQAVAAAALATYGDDAIAALMTALHQPATELIAVQALARIATPAVLPGLAMASQSAQATCRETAIEALSHIHQGTVAPLLIQALQDPAASVRQAAIQGLSHRRDLLAEVDSLAALESCLWDVNLAVCQAAARALGRLGSGLDATAVAPLVNTLAHVLRSPLTPLPLQLAVVQALIWLEAPAALTALNLDWAGLDGTLQRAIATGLGQVSSAQAAVASTLLIEQLTHPTVTLAPPVRQAIAHSLGQLGQVAAIPVLVPLLADESESVQFHAIAALKRLNPHHPALGDREL